MEDEYFGGLVEKLRHGERHTEPSAPAAEAGEHRVHKVQWRACRYKGKEVDYARWLVGEEDAVRRR